MKRPTPKELFNKLKGAGEAAAAGNVALLNQSVLACDAIDLCYVIDGELIELLPECLNEMKPDHYAGLYPPQRSYQTEISGLELFAFRAYSAVFACEVYVKFALAEDFLWLVSFHQNRTGEEEP
jgi:hypothetical protein